MDQQNLEGLRQRYERLKSVLEVLRREIHDVANMLQVMEAAHADLDNNAKDSCNVEKS